MPRIYRLILSWKWIVGGFFGLLTILTTSVDDPPGWFWLLHLAGRFRRSCRFLVHLSGIQRLIAHFWLVRFPWVLPTCLPSSLKNCRSRRFQGMRVAFSRQFWSFLQTFQTTHRRCGRSPGNGGMLWKPMVPSLRLLCHLQIHCQNGRTSWRHASLPCDLVVTWDLKSQRKV